MKLLEDTPLEVRQLIYIAYLRDASIVWHRRGCNCVRFLCYRLEFDAWKLLTLCRQIKEEAEPLAYFYAQTEFGRCTHSNPRPQSRQAWLRTRRLLVHDSVFPYWSNSLSRKGGYEIQPAYLLSDAVTSGNLRYIMLSGDLSLAKDHEHGKLRSIVRFSIGKDVTTSFKLRVTYQTDVEHKYYDLLANITIAKTYNVTVSVLHGLLPAIVCLEHFLRSCYGRNVWNKVNFQLRSVYDDLQTFHLSGTPKAKLIMPLTEQAHKCMRSEVQKNGYIGEWSKDRRITMSRINSQRFTWAITVPIDAELIPECI